MSHCESYKPYLAALADGQTDAIPPETRPQLEAHLAACPDCQADLAQQVQMAQLFATATPPAIPAARWQHVWDAIDEQTTRREHRHRLLFAGRNRLIAAAGSIAVAAMILLAVLLGHPDVPAPKDVADGPVQTYAFATQNDSNIEAVETYGDEQTPMVITSGQQNVVVVWMVENPLDSQSNT